jgi:IS30 family transposase
VAKRKWERLSSEDRRQAIRLSARGMSLRQIGAEIGRGKSLVQIVLRPLGGVIRRELVEETPGRLSAEDRVEIRLGLERRESYAQIARDLGVHRSTVCREVKANGGRHNYRPLTAHRRAVARARRPKMTKLAANPQLCQRVSERLEALWSPQQIAISLRAESGGDPMNTVSHETIYKSLYVQGRGELRRELTRCLRTRRTTRKPNGRLETRGRIPDMVNISARPAEVADRAVAGHWEGDLIMGTHNSAVGTLVERRTRFVMLLHLPNGHGAEAVREAMAAKILTLPAALRRSITWDQGKEMSQHAQFTIDTNVQIYFCDPHSPWQRGSNENTNGLLRQYMPKGTDLRKHTEADLDAFADSLNSRPRETLGWMTPSEKLNQTLVAMTG